MLMKFLLWICGLRIVHNYEDVTVIGQSGQKIIRAKIDSGANRTSIDKIEAMNLGLISPENVVENKLFQSGLGKEFRDIISITFILKGKTLTTLASVSDREHMSHKMIIGRKDLTGFLIKPDPDGEGR